MRLLLLLPTTISAILLVGGSWFGFPPLVSGFRPCPTTATTVAARQPLLRAFLGGNSAREDRMAGRRTPGVARLSATNNNEDKSRENNGSEETKETKDAVSSEPVALSPEQDRALRAAARAMEEKGAFGDGWYSNADAWERIRTDHPVLASLTPGELRRAYLSQPPDLFEVLLKTPVGPMILAGLVSIGFQWDFYQDIFFGGAKN